MAAPRWARACTSRSPRWWPRSSRSISTRCRSPPPPPARCRTPRPPPPPPAPTSTAWRRRPAARMIKERLVAFAAEHWQVHAGPGRVPAATWCGSATRRCRSRSWCAHAYFGRVQLSATGFYKTPKIHWDRAAGRGRPFYYFAYGAAVSEVTVDTLTGEYRLDRVDILHDCGQVAEPGDRPGPDRGRLRPGHGLADHRGAVVGRQGPAAHPCALAPTRSRPARDRPRIFNVEPAGRSANREDTIYRSKAVGEPPLMLAISVLHALSDAVASVADHRLLPAAGRAGDAGARAGRGRAGAAAAEAA